MSDATPTDTRSGVGANPAPAGGTVFDIGYRNYAGMREGIRRSRLAVYRNGVRTALGIGRGGRAKFLPIGFMVVLAVIGLIMALIAGAVDRYTVAGMAKQLNLPSHADYYGIAAIILFVFAAVVAPELLCRDKREGVISLYLVRPLTGSDYIIARWLAFLSVILVAALLPQIILFLGLMLSDPVPFSYFKAHWTDIPKFLAAGSVMAVYTTTLALLTASYTTRRAYASVFLVGLVVISAPFTIGLAQELSAPAGQWVSMFNLTNIPLHVSDIIFGEVSDLTKIAPARQLGPRVLLLWCALWIVVPGRGRVALVRSSRCGERCDVRRAARNHRTSRTQRRRQDDSASHDHRTRRGVEWNDPRIR
jgi:ABC-2 type transport system permease protein